MAKFEMDTDFIRKLAAILEETRPRRDRDGRRRAQDPRRPADRNRAGASHDRRRPDGGRPCAAARCCHAAAAGIGDISKHPGAVKSPMVGTAYLSPEPGKPVFVNVGDKVTAGQTLLIIEAMKTFNPIKAPKAGTVTQILIENAQPVEFGEPLMIVE